ncbi:hypothetical protein PAPYR_7205 [Paratrimastix pyriformis]|uniref:Uncharacterized protein n=1 Tax=Paratrimastix pyriformis TaxID=342808 RepID=A0ABQ8UDP5_9EUKA|nr:hypothetical protein PAPYR_7205 [Paratrimastix pyriformis]
MTLSYFLYTLNDADIKSTIRQYMGTSQQVTDFAEEFVRRKQFDTDPNVKISGPATPKRR